MTLPNNIAQFTLFAQAEYSCDAYGAGAYGQCETTGATTPSGTGGSSLVNTGITVGIFVAIAAIILVLALLVRFWSKKKKQRDNTTPRPPQPPVPPQNPPTPPTPKIGG